MTLVAGFVCSDGIVVCADSLYTGVNKTYGDKVWALSVNAVTVVFAGADEELLIHRAKDKLETRLQDKKPKTLGAARDIVDGLVHEIHREDVMPNALVDENFRLSALACIRAPDGLGLFESDMGTLARVPERVCLSNASGEALGKYLSSWLFDISMPTAWGRVLAAHMLRLTGEYSTNIGGKSHIVTIPKDGQVSESSQEDVAELEAYLEKVDTPLREILLRGFDPNVPSKEIEPHVDALIDALGIARFKSVQYLTEGGVMNTYGKVPGDRHK